MTRTYKLSSKETKIEAVGGKYVLIENKGEGTIYASLKQSVKAGADGVVAIAPQSAKMIVADPQYRFNRCSMNFDWVAPIYVVSTDDTEIEVTADVERNFIIALCGSYDVPDESEEDPDATNNLVIKLAADSTKTFTIAEGEVMTINLNGNTLTNVEGSATVVNSGTLTISDRTGTGTIDGTTHKKAAIENKAGATLIIESGIITRSAEASTSPSDSGGNSYYVIDNSGTLIINGGEIRGKSFYSSLIRNIGPDSKLIVNGGKLTNNFIVLKNDDEGTMEINNGVITCAAEKGSALQNWGKATINGGTFNAEADLARSLWASTWSDDYTSETIINGGTFNGKMFIAQDSQYAKSISTVPDVTITGGTINGDILIGNDSAADSYCTANVTITGGTLTGQIIEAENTKGDGKTNNITIKTGSIAS